MSKLSKIFTVTTMAAVLAGGYVSGTAIAAGIPTFDGAAAANFLEQMKELQKQLDVAKSQLSEAKRMYDTVSGYRGFGDVLRNQELAKYLPDDWKGIYDSVKSGNYHDITGSVQDILDDERITGNTNDARTAALEREAKLAATNKAMAMQAFNGTQQRLQQIEGLMNQIGQTQDPKAISELQARIAGEQASIQNETTKLQLMAQLQKAEQDLLVQQKREIMRRDFSAANTGMPEIK
ncbi:P-type DNA transfer protein VirB5 [Brucella cytisi]|uniref:P-type DNA transfer protein VirB5 n=1 Tax=Brucella cytisi TaxID=407152 RepID=A0A1J6I5V1_9HYPH|nr:P-type DNA transfer protein VirB5 [Brucella cytisi]OIS90312.1 P-type DNA transfer protein VirB5 [Brucella cytisi]